MSTPTPDTVLEPELLQRIRARAERYDRENSFFHEDLDELRTAGYLRARPLLQVVRDQRLLAAHAPATALGLNMHLVWVGVARVLAARGDHSLQWVSEEADAGELFAFGNSEPGNDLVLWDSLTTATPTDDGGFSFTGTKIFTSLSPAWTRLGIFGKQHDGPDGPRLVHAFLTRDAPGWRSLEDWDALGMRATQSHTTALDGAVADPDRVTRFLPVGPNADPFVFGIFANFLLSIAAVYAGIADRSLELAVEAAHRRTSLRTGASYAADPDIRWQIADIALDVDPLRPELESLAADVDEVRDHGADWFRYLTGAKHRATETARRAVDRAARVSGGGGYRSTAELARLQRDVLAGIFHPSDTESIHSTVATNLLGPA